MTIELNSESQKTSEAELFLRVFVILSTLVLLLPGVDVFTHLCFL